MAVKTVLLSAVLMEIHSFMGATKDESTNLLITLSVTTTISI